MKALALGILACLAAAPAARAEQPVLAVMDFVGSGVSPGELALFGDFLASHIVQAGGYAVVDRLQRQALLEEIELSWSDLADPGRQLEIGRLLAAGSIVTGSLGRFGGQFLLNVQLIEVETGRTENAVSGTYASLEELLAASRPLAHRLLGVQAPAGAEAAGAELTGAAPASLAWRSIAVDGDLSDWGGIPPVLSDPVGDHGDGLAGTDIAGVYLARDRENLYVRFALAGRGLPARPRGYMQALLAVNLANEDYLLLAVFYRDGWRAAVHTWNPRAGKSAPIAFGAVARGGDGFEARYPLAALRGHLQEGRAYATGAKIGAAVEKRYRDLDTAGLRFIAY